MRKGLPKNKINEGRSEKVSGMLKKDIPHSGDFLTIIPLLITYYVAEINGSNLASCSVHRRTAR